MALLGSVIGPKKLAPSSQPTKFKSKENRDAMTRVFTRTNQLAYFYFDFSLALCTSSFVLIGHCDYFDFGFTSLSRQAL